MCGLGVQGIVSWRPENQYSFQTGRGIHATPSQPALMRTCEVFLLTKLVGAVTPPFASSFSRLCHTFPLHTTDNKVLKCAGSCFRASLLSDSHTDGIIPQPPRCSHISKPCCTLGLLIPGAAEPSEDKRKPLKHVAPPPHPTGAFAPLTFFRGAGWCAALPRP